MPGSPVERVELLIAAVGLDPGSFQEFLDWALSEHLVSVLAALPELKGSTIRQRDGLKRFRDVLETRTKRRWSARDLNTLYERVRQAQEKHSRKPIPYEDYLRLLWQVPWECVRCSGKPPDVVLHIDHIVPASLGGSSKRPNLQFLCAEHNLAKSNKREVTGPWLDLQ